jgi:hypothetical protein
MASITITTNSAQDARIAEAIGSILLLGRNANAGEVKDYLTTYLRDSVLRYERDKAKNEASAGVTPIDVT